MDEPTNLAELLRAAAAKVDPLVATEAGGTTEYRRGDRVFAVADPGTAEFRLHPEVADAARRTPDCGPSGRGPEWARFVPRQIDRHAADRAEAWFLSAWRAAEEK